MPLVNGGAFTGVVSYYRLLWIGGKFGGYKTSLAYILARTYLEKGYRLITNNQSIWADDIDRMELLPGGKLKAVCILDEGGEDFNDRRQVQQVAKYARKMDCIYIIPSFFPPARMAQVLSVWSMFSFVSAGLPIVVYRWQAKLGPFRDGGIFLLVNPSEIYGIYSSNDPGARAGKIVNKLIGWSDDYRKLFGHTDDDSISEVEASSEADKILEASEIMESAASDLAALPSRGRRRRGI
jgi:hypothetical protein